MSSSDRGKQILVIRIDLGNGIHDEITVFEEDEPFDLALQFCEKHNLDVNVQSALTNMIEHNIDILIEEELSFKEKIENIGAEMYSKGIQMKEKLKHEIERTREINQMIEMKDVTFKPKINQNSNILFNKAKHLHDCLKTQMEEVKIKENQENYFTPKINQHSKELVEKKQNEIDKFLALYEEAKARDNRKHKLTEEYQQKNYPFKPEVNRIPKNRRSSSVSRPVSEISNAKSNERIQMIFQEQRINRYFSLFELLNSTPEGKISKMTIKHHKLPEIIATILEPLLDELIESEDEIDFSEFLQAMDALVSTLDSTKKAIILAPSHRWSSLKAPKTSARIPMYERMLLKQMRTEEKIKEKRLNMQAEKMKECTFQPQVLKRASSNRIMSS